MHRFVRVRVRPFALPLPVSTHALGRQVQEIFLTMRQILPRDAAFAVRALAGWAPILGRGPHWQGATLEPGEEGLELTPPRHSDNDPPLAEEISTRWRMSSSSGGLEGIDDRVHPLLGFRVRVPDRDTAALLVTRLRERRPPWLERAFVEPRVAPSPVVTDWPVTTGLSSSSLDFRRDSPVGVGVSAVVGVAGTNGAGVRLADVEQGWWVEAGLGPKSLLHQEFLGGSSPARARVVNRPASPTEESHGTQVLGVLYAQVQGPEQGTRGMVPRLARVVLAGTVGVLGDDDSANAIHAAAADLRPGDVMLVERQATVMVDGDAVNGPVEADREVFLAVAGAVAQGIVVVVPAGNNSPAGRRLDDAKEVDSAQKIASWGDSGSIWVAAGQRVDKQWQGWPRSNHGARVNCFAHGAGVRTVTTETSLPVGTLAGEISAKISDSFTDTSAAGAIVAGVVVAIQGARRAAGKDPLTPAVMRDLLMNPDLTEGNTSAGFGRLPDLARLVPAALAL